MILFVTSAELPFFPARGGTETFTFGVIRELHRRGIEAGVLNVGRTQEDGRDLLPDIPFLDVPNTAALRSLDATLVSVVRPQIAQTKHPAYMMMHVPPISAAYPRSEFVAAARSQHLITNSAFARAQWATYLDISPADIAIIYPFADPAFATVQRPQKTTTATRVLFAGRLTPEKGVYLLLEALHRPALAKGYEFTVTTAGGESANSEQSAGGKLILQLLRSHPRIHLVEARSSPLDMAKLLAQQDVLVMPSNHYFWQEAFGMLSVEAQHAGCRVVASDTGGLPETDCGNLYLFEPGNSHALAAAIEKAAQAGSVTASLRKKAAKHFTVEQTVDSLLATIQYKFVESLTARG